MGIFKSPTLEAITLQNLSVGTDGFDPVLTHVDFELPLDQTVVVQSSNPFHSIQFLQILAGQLKPLSGRVVWNEKDIYSDEDTSEYLPHQLIGCYFENQRPHPQKTVQDIWTEAGLSKERQDDIFEQFELLQYKTTNFKKLTYELQKLVQLIAVIAKEPQMLILEDPAAGLSETNFLEVLDLIQYGQRRGNLRHVYFTNHHPTALRHMNATVMHLEGGLLYVEEIFESKKLFNF